MGNLNSERYRSANRVEVWLRGPGPQQLLGKGFTGRSGEGTNVTGRSSTGAQYQHVIGTPHPAGITDGRYEHSITLSLLQLTSRAAAEVITSDTVDIDIIDRITNKTVKTFEECHCQNGDITVPANNIVTETLSFIAMRVVVPTQAA